ncbi:hypothetical protein [Ferruginibacter sp.]|nr:hypothetical protein [Ferruginibacter sp.]
MSLTDYLNCFNDEENVWLTTHTKVKNELFAEIEDISNVNPLENGDPDLGSLNIAIQAAKFTIFVSKNKILAGPYDTNHCQLIKKYFPSFNLSEKLFWQIFSFECANKKGEGFKNKERIYLSALTAMIFREELSEIDKLSLGVYNMNTGKIEQIKGVGVNARMS